MINLDSATDRWTAAQQQLTPFNINLIRYPATDTRTFDKVLNHMNQIDDVAMANLAILQRTKRRRLHRELSNGAVGCYLSHMGIYRNIVDSDVTTALIMEDDIDINATEVAKMAEVCDRLPTGWDIILLGCTNRDRPQHPVIDGFQRVDWFWGLHCYLIHREAARRILTHLLPIPEIVRQTRAPTQIQVPLLTNDPKYVKRHIKK
jgi:glycosyl transferase family 25